MGKTKAEIIAEYRELKKENLKLTNTIHQLSRDEDARRAVLAQLKKDVATWKDMAQKENDRVVDLATELDGKSKELAKWIKASKEYEETIAKLCIDLDESEKEKTLIRSQRDNLLLEHERMATEFGHIQDDLEILQAEVRKIQYDEEVTHDQGYEEGYTDAEYRYKEALEQSNTELKKFIEHNRRLQWVISQIYENQTK